MPGAKNKTAAHNLFSEFGGSLAAQCREREGEWA